MENQYTKMVKDKKENMPGKDNSNYELLQQSLRDSEDALTAIKIAKTKGGTLDEQKELFEKLRLQNLKRPSSVKLKETDFTDAPSKAGEGKFTKAEYLIQRLENTLKDPNADPYVKKTFPGFIDELKANPDLAKDENVFKELGGDLPKDQQIVVYGDDTLDFFTQKEGPGNIDILAKFMEDNPFLSREEALNISKMEPTDRVTELTKLKFLSKKKTDNAEGGIINLAQGGMI